MSKFTTMRLMELYKCWKKSIIQITKQRTKIYILESKLNILKPNRESYLWHTKTINER